MSLQGRMREAFHVYARTAETDTPVRKATVNGRIEYLSANGARRESLDAEPDLTHSGRFPEHKDLQVGRRLRKVSDNTEYIIRVSREQGPPPGHLHLLLAEVEPSLT